MRGIETNWAQKTAHNRAKRGYLKCSIRGTSNQLPNRFYKFVYLKLFNVKYNFVNLQLFDVKKTYLLQLEENKKTEKVEDTRFLWTRVFSFGF